MPVRVLSTMVLFLMALLWAPYAFSSPSPPRFRTINEVMEDFDVEIMIQGVVEKVETSDSQPNASPTNDVNKSSDVTITYRIVESYPAISEQILTFPGRRALDLGAQYLFPLKRTGDDNGYRYGFEDAGGYLIDLSGSEPTVARFFESQSQLPLNRAWEIIREIYDQTHGKKASNPEAIERHKKAFKEGTFNEAVQALDLLTLYPESPLTEADLIAAIETQYAALFANDSGATDNIPRITTRFSQGPKSSFRNFTHRVLELLTPIASENSVQRFVDLYLKDTSSPSTRVFDQDDLEPLILKLVVKQPGPNRSQRLHELLGRCIDDFDKNGRYGGITVMIPEYPLLCVLAETSGEDIDAIIEEIYASPGRFHRSSGGTPLPPREELQKIRKESVSKPSTNQDNLMAKALLRYEQGKAGLPSILLLCRDQDSKYVIPILNNDNLTKDKTTIANIIRWKNPDPPFIPMLRDALKDTNQMRNTETTLYLLLSALYQCGAKQEALDYTRNLLSRPMADQSNVEFYCDAAIRSYALLFLGDAGDSTDIPLLKRYTTLETIKAYQEMFETLNAKGDRFSSTPGYGPVDKLYEKALLARVRIHDSSVVSELQTLYGSEYVGQRITAATVLFYLGDNTSAPLIELFRQHTEKTDALLADHFIKRGLESEFQKTITYLRSPETDILFIERLRNGFDNGDKELVCDASFLMEHANEVVVLLEKYLVDHDRDSRKNAVDCLEKITGITVSHYDYSKSLLHLRNEAQLLLTQWKEIPTNKRLGNTPATSPKQ